MSYFGELEQKITVSTLNSTIANIVSLPTHFGNTAWYWCGKEESTLAVVLIQMSIKLDKNATIWVEQSSGETIQTGTVTTASNTSLIGSGTTFSRYKVGETIIVAGETARQIATILSDTSLTVTNAFSTAGGGKAFSAYEWDLSDDFHYNVLKDNIGINIQAISSYYRVRVVLSGTSATTFLRLQSILCPIGNPLPRSLADDGSLKVRLFGGEDEDGHKLDITPMRDLRVVESSKLVGSSFKLSLDTNFWTASNIGAGSAAGVANAIATLSSGTANNGFGKIISIRSARFQFGQPLLQRGMVKINTLSIANNNSYWGAFSETAQVPQNGVAFSVSTTGILSVHCFNNGTPNTVTSGNFNGIVNEFVLTTNVYAYEIVYYTASASFYIDGTLIHTFRPTTSILYQTLDVPICAMSVNSASGTVNRTIELWNAVIIKHGKIINAGLPKFTAGVVTAVVAKIGSGTLARVILGDNTSAGTLIIYDAVTATNTIASIAWSNNTAPSSMNIELPFFTGLCYSTTGGNTKVTLIYE